MLKIDRVDSFYGGVQVLRDLSLQLDSGEVLCLLGRNGAGKTTLLKTIMGLVRYSGSIALNGQSLVHLKAHQIPRYGIGYVPQGRRLFAELSVAENLEIGLMTNADAQPTLDSVFELFPLLRERLKQVSGTLSGGEQQMLAMARALCLQPQVLLLDEPTEGLMPSMIAGIRETVLKLRAQGVAILLVEQRVEAVLPLADRVVFIENGVIKKTLEGAELAQNPDLLHRYVGV